MWRLAALVVLVVVVGFGCGIAIGSNLTSSAARSKTAPLSTLQQEHLIEECIVGGHPLDCRMVGMSTNTGPPPVLSPGANAVFLFGPHSL
jgi:hypothetical protein